MMAVLGKQGLKHPKSLSEQHGKSTKPDSYKSVQCFDNVNKLWLRHLVKNLQTTIEIPLKENREILSVYVHCGIQLQSCNFGGNIKDRGPLWIVKLQYWELIAFLVGLTDIEFLCSYGDREGHKT